MNPFSSPFSTIFAVPPVMKRNLYFVLGALCTATLLLSTDRALAQNAKPPTQLSYQGFLTDGSGVPFGNSAPVNKTVIFRIYDALIDGNLKWSSSQVVTVDKGYFSVLLGQGSQVGSETFNPDLTSLFTGPNASDRYLELNADGTRIAPRLRFLASPYAMLAKSATELLDPITGTSSLSITSGNISSGGELRVSGFFATNNITAGSILGTFLQAVGSTPIHSEGMYLEWNKNIGDGISYLLNQRGGGPGGIVFGEVSTANLITERMRIDNNGNVFIGSVSSGKTLEVGKVNAASLNGDGFNIGGLDASKITAGTIPNGRTTAVSENTPNSIVARDSTGNIKVNQVVANSFKLNGKPKLDLISISRASVKATSSPIDGFTQTVTPDGTKRESNPPSDWWKSTSSSGYVNYIGTFVVPNGEYWEAVYSVHFDWDTDDAGGLVWSMDDNATDDAYLSLAGLTRAIHSASQTFLMPSGTHYVRLKTVIKGGSGDDHIHCPYGTFYNNNLVVKKYNKTD